MAALSFHLAYISLEKESITNYWPYKLLLADHFDGFAAGPFVLFRSGLMVLRLREAWLFE